VSTPDKVSAGFGASSLTWYGFYDPVFGNALEDSTWTFDHGSADPLEGWKPFDMSGDMLTYDGLSAFRRVSAGTWAGHDNTVPAPVLAGSVSVWVGFFEDEADDLCWKGGLGYGNYWRQRFVSPTLTYDGFGSIDLSFKYFHNTEPGYDFVRVILEQDGAPDSLLAVYDGTGGTPATPLVYMQSIFPKLAAQSSIRFIFEFESDGGYSDEDSLYVTDSGPFGVDDILIENNLLEDDQHYDFEADFGGWTIESIPGVSDFIDINNVSGYPLPPDCSLDGNVVSFHDVSNRHPAGQYAKFSSPAVPLVDVGAGQLNVFTEWDFYADLPQADSVRIWWSFDYYPYLCPETGAPIWSPVSGANYVFYFTTPYCWTDRRTFATDSTAGVEFEGASGRILIPAGADSARFHIYVLGRSVEDRGNFSPVFDNIRIGVSSPDILHVPCNSYPTIQAAIDSAAVGDTVLVMNGTYTGADNRDLDFGGKSIVVMSENGSSSTIIDCEGTGRGFVFQSGEDTTAAVSGFTVKNGSTTGGGAILIQTSSSPTITDCIFDANSADNGGAVSISNGSPRFENCTFESNNATTGNGGAVNVSSGAPRFSSCIFVSNGAVAQGGAAHVSGGTPAFSDCTIWANQSQDGGAVNSSGGTVSLADCRITGNEAASHGGAICVSSTGTVSATRATISGNKAGTDGGGICAISGGSTVTLHRVIVWDNCAGGSGGEIHAGGGTINLTCCDVDASGVSGSGTFNYLGDNVFTDPVFCAPEDCANAPITGGDYTIASNSPCTSANSPCDELIGLYDIGCTWGDITMITDVANDQGRRVRVRWNRAKQDTAAAMNPVHMYSLWRRVKPGLVAQRISGYPPPPGLIPPPGNWDFLLTIPASGAADYSTVAETLCDSTISQGQCYSTFFVRGHAAMPTDVFDSAPDSGYSVDNLSPLPPINLNGSYNTGSGNQLDWDPSTDVDFQFFKIYRGNNPDFTPDPGNFVEAIVADEWTDPGYDGWNVYYKITTVDFSGNESMPSSPDPVTAVELPGVPIKFHLYQNLPNPFNPTTTIKFDTAGEGRLDLRVYDVSGRLVRTLVDESRPPGRYSVIWDGRDNKGQPVASGVYFCRMTGTGITMTRKMVLLQ
jgi:hypothetical protein